MARSTRTIPNRAARWTSIVYFLIALLGGYGLLAGSEWRVDWRVGLATVGLLLMLALGFRSLTSGVVVDPEGLRSRFELGTARLRWQEIAHFESRGRTIRNKVGALTTDGRWVLLQYHPFAEDYATLLERSRPTLRQGELEDR